MVGIGRRRVRQWARRPSSSFQANFSLTLFRSYISAQQTDGAGGCKIVTDGITVGRTDDRVVGGCNDKGRYSLSRGWSNANCNKREKNEKWGMRSFYRSPRQNDFVRRYALARPFPISQLEAIYTASLLRLIIHRFYRKNCSICMLWRHSQNQRLEVLSNGKYRWPGLFGWHCINHGRMGKGGERDFPLEFCVRWQYVSDGKLLTTTATTTTKTTTIATTTITTTTT